MKILSRCPHCHQIEPVNPALDAQSALNCRSCGIDYVPQRHLFVADALTDVTIPIRDEAPHAPVTSPAPMPVTARREPASLVWAVICLALLTGLGLQVAHTHRDIWAAQWPDTQPGLQAMCQWLKCNISAPEELDAVSVISSGFDQQDENNFTFSLHLQHTKDHDVATPAVELTLTDAQERPVMRKILLPQDIGLPVAIPSGQGLVTETRFSLDADVQSHVSGFRVELFYP